MLYHIRPRLCSAFNLVRILRLTIEPFDIELVGDVDVVARRPYRAKQYAVVCAKSEITAVDGIFIETPQRVPEIRYTAKWALAGRIFTHRVILMIVDNDFEGVTDSMMLWLETGRKWKKRWPEGIPGAVPLYLEPVMDVLTDGQPRVGMEDWMDHSGYIIRREQVLHVPTVELDRLLNPAPFTYGDPAMPDINLAFRIPQEQFDGRCMLCGGPATDWCGCSRQPQP